MAIGVVGRKCGMTRVFSDTGEAIPVTVIHVEPNRVTQVKTKENDGYLAIQVTTGTKRANRVTKPMAGHFAKAKTEAGRGLWEFHLNVDEVEGENLVSVGDVIDLNRFQVGQCVDVTATSKGKGFAGVIKRHNFSSQRNSHGNSKAHRAPGSIGQNQSPGRVFKGKKMAGQLGNKRSTVQNQEIIQIDNEKGILLLKGTVPGAPGGDVIVKPGIKKDKQRGDK